MAIIMSTLCLPRNSLMRITKNLYWIGEIINGTAVKTTVRAHEILVHYHLLKKYIPEFFNSGKKTIVNFGAGGGGISNLFWFDGFEIINVEPSGTPQSYESNWKTIDSIYELDEEESSIDLLYGSHSLEHVQSINDFKKVSSKVLKSGGYMFWEVLTLMHQKWLL